MADNVTTQSSTLATIPASTKIATDEDATNGHVQIVKLAISTDGSATPLTADNTDGMLVNLGTNNDVTVTNATAANLKVDGSDVTQPVSAASLPLPSGAATAANQTTGNSSLSTIAGAVAGSEMQVDIVADGAGLLTTAAHDAAFGTAGTADTQVRTVQGIASMTPLLVDATGQGDVPITLDGEAVAISGTVTVDLGANNDVVQATHDNFNANANIQVNNTDVAATNPVPVRPNEYELVGNTTHVKKYYTAATPTDGIVWSPAAGKRWYVTDIIVNVTAAATVTFEDDLTGGDDPVLVLALAANSGLSHSFQTPLYSGEDAADLLVTATAGTVYVTVTGYEI